MKTMVVIFHLIVEIAAMVEIATILVIAIEQHDWLNPGGIHSYSYWYPTYYESSWYPTYSYTYYPTYYYSKPVVYPTYYYDPVVYDPWYATNVYGWGGSSYYTSSWSWSRYGGCGLYF